MVINKHFSVFILINHIIKNTWITFFAKFSDVFGTRVGRVSPKIYEIQEELREAQRKAAMRRSKIEEQSKSYGTS